MSNSPPNRLIVIAGPSCAGKSPLAKALARIHPELCENLEPVVLYNSRAPRVGEKDGVDYHFRKQTDIEALGEQDPDRYVVMDVRGDTQALDLEALAALLKKGDALFEGNPFVGKELVSRARKNGTPCVNVFVSPLSGEEITSLSGQPGVEIESLVTDVMRRKLLRRTRKQKGEISLRDLEEIERRCGSAWTEIQDAVHFDHVLPNHDGEDSENWDAFYHPLGDARRTFLAVAALLRGDDPPLGVESWRDGFPPS